MAISSQGDFDTLDSSNEVDASRPNRDPITGARGAHPMGVGVGAATAGAVGGVIGSAIPVVGTAIGVAVGTALGAVVGGIAGKGAAEVLFPTEEESYWREHHRPAPENALGAPYTFDQDYLAAYRFGYINSHAYTQSYEEVEEELRAAWETSRDSSRLNWSDARGAVQMAWERARIHQRNTPETSDTPR